MSIVTDCADLARVEQSLGIVKQQKAMMLERAAKDIDDLHSAIYAQKDADKPTWLSFSDACAAIRTAVDDYAADAIDSLEQRRADLIERIQAECERREMHCGQARNALANAALHRASIRDRIRRAKQLEGWTRADLLADNTSPLYAFRSDWASYRDWMRHAFERRQRRAA